MRAFVLWAGTGARAACFMSVPHALRLPDTPAAELLVAGWPGTPQAGGRTRHPASGAESPPHPPPSADPDTHPRRAIRPRPLCPIIPPAASSIGLPATYQPLNPLPYGHWQLEPYLHSIYLIGVGGNWRSLLFSGHHRQIYIYWKNTF